MFLRHIAKAWLSVKSCYCAVQVHQEQTNKSIHSAERAWAVDSIKPGSISSEGLCSASTTSACPSVTSCGSSPSLEHLSRWNAGSRRSRPQLSLHLVRTPWSGHWWHLSWDRAPLSDSHQCAPLRVPAWCGIVTLWTTQFGMTLVDQCLFGHWNQRFTY